MQPHVLVGHALFAALVAWIGAGILRALALAGLRPDPEPARPGPLAVGIVEGGVALALLNLLFLAFVAVQVPYFFGTESVLRQAGTDTFAAYARRGFFELVTVAGLVLPLLLFAAWAVRRERPAHERVFRALAGTTVALLFVIMASALHRMRLYLGAYGLTELRVYTSAFMVWLGIVFVLFAWTVLRGRPERFAFPAAMAALATIVLLHAADPDARIVRTNAARAPAQRFDTRYAASLSADAVPALLAALDGADAAGRCAAARTLSRRWTGPRDWRSWSLSLHRAGRAMEAHAPALAAMDCPPPARPRPPVRYDGRASTGRPRSRPRRRGAWAPPESWHTWPPGVR